MIAPAGFETHVQVRGVSDTRNVWWLLAAIVAVASTNLSGCCGCIPGCCDKRPAQPPPEPEPEPAPVELRWLQAYPAVAVLGEEVLIQWEADVPERDHRPCALQLYEGWQNRPVPCNGSLRHTFGTTGRHLIRLYVVGGYEVKRCLSLFSCERVPEEKTAAVIVHSPPEISRLELWPDPTPAGSSATLRWDANDPEGGTLTCTFDLDGDGVSDRALWQCPEDGELRVVFEKTGTFNLSLSVFDGHAYTRRSLPVTVVPDRAPITEDATDSSTADATDSSTEDTSASVDGGGQSDPGLDGAVAAREDAGAAAAGFEEPTEHEMAAEVNRLATSRAGSLFAVGLRDGTVRVIDAAPGGAPTRSWVHHERWIAGVDFGPRDERLAVIDSDGYGAVYALSDGERLVELSTSGTAKDLAWRPGSEELAIPFTNKPIQLWSATEGTVVLGLGHHATEIAGMDWSGDGETLLTGAGNGKALLWRPPDTYPVGWLIQNAGVLDEVAWAADSEALAGVSSKGHAYRFTLGEERVLWDVDLTSSRLYAVAWSPGAQRLATGGAGQQVLILDAADGATLARLQLDGTVRALAWSPEGVLAAGSGSTVTVWRPL